MKVAFEAQIMQNNIKSLINKLHSAEKTVMAVIMDKEK